MNTAAAPIGGDGRAETLPYTELLLVHDCLRVEVDGLAALAAIAAANHGCPHTLASFAARFRLLLVVFQAHSRAEDEIIMPAMAHRGLDLDAVDELEADHKGHGAAFAQLQSLLESLLAQQRPVCEKQLEQLVNKMNAIRASLRLHLRKEEEELFPVLGQHFSREELDVMAGRIMGNRSSELVRLYLELLGRGLAPDDKQTVIQSIVNAAKGTRFARWLSHERSDVRNTTSVDDDDVKMTGASDEKEQQEMRVVQGVAKSFHESCPSLGECCQTQEKVLGCRHYKRNCLLHFECCGKLFCCRFCHDEAVAEVPAQQGEKWHCADRFAVKTMCCMICSMQQPVAVNCLSCMSPMAKYACLICNFFDDADARPIYHCPYCNVCRVGRGLGQDMVHCMKCNVCISSKLFAQGHECMEAAGEADCPICLEKLFLGGTEPVQRLRCGHGMHRHCFRAFSETHFRCPTCRKSASDMGAVWQKYDEVKIHLLAALPVDALTRARSVHCDDCGVAHQAMRPTALPESLPDQCVSCSSYNTQFKLCE